jgi:hypothetical protein
MRTIILSPDEKTETIDIFYYKHYGKSSKTILTKNSNYMKNAIILTTVVAILAIGLPGIAHDKITPGNDEWTLLGSRQVDYLIDRDEIDIVNGTYDELKLSVKNGTLNMHKCTVHFTDGTNRDIDFKDEVSSSSGDRIVDFEESDKIIDKVTFWYDTTHKSDAKATVEVWGKKE